MNLVLKMLFKKFCTGLIIGLMKDLVGLLNNQVSVHWLLWTILGKFLHKITCRIKKFKKGLINIKNDDQKCFLLCHVRHINPVKIHRERITQNGKKLADDLDYDRVGFPVWEKDFSKIELKNNIFINVFCYENKLVFPFYVSD